MSIECYIKKIKESISKKSYEEYKSLFVEYHDFLKKLIEENPKNIKAVCQLAIIKMELRESTDQSIELLEDVKCKYINELSTNEIVELLNDLAYFYKEEECDEKQAKLILQKTVQYQSIYPQPFYALGMIYFEEGNYTDALCMFEKANAIINDKTYLFSCAVCLYYLGDFKQSIAIFKTLSHDWQSDEVSARAYYYFGMMNALNGNTTEGIEVANHLSLILNKENYYIDSNLLADLYYICNDFEKCVELYDYEKLYFTNDWLSIYFYSLLKLNMNDLILEKLNEVIEEKEQEIIDAPDYSDDHWTIEEIQEMIKSLKDEIIEIKEVYDKIVNEDFRPNITFKLYLFFKCYLIDCPRHRI